MHGTAQQQTGTEQLETSLSSCFFSLEAALGKEIRSLLPL